MKTRRDQVQCPNPKCESWGCPSNGSKGLEDGMHRYRKCSACGTAFHTREAYGTRGETVVEVFGLRGRPGRKRKAA